MKRVKIVKCLIVVVLVLQLLVSSTSLLGYYHRYGGRKKPSECVDDPELANIIESINTLKEKIKDSPQSSWKRPGWIRKFVMCLKLNGLNKQVARNKLEAAHDKMNSDIKPKLTTSWVTDEELQADFGINCDIILTKINAIINPEVDPPVISLTPDQVISDADVVGGFLLEWEITDESGISEATVNLNGEVIASYNDYASIVDSYLLVNTPGEYLVEITAIDNTGLASVAQSTLSIVDDDITAPTIDIYYVGSGTSFDPGWWDIVVEDPESGIDEVSIVVNEYVFVHENLGGQQSNVYTKIYVPASSGIYTLEVNVTNNDMDWNGDQQTTSETDIVEIIPADVDPPVISLNPPTLTITDEDAIGGFPITWQINDESGIFEAVVSLNGDPIASYNDYDSISDSYLIANTLSNNLIEITAVDNIGLASSAQSTISIVDDDTTAPTIVIQYIGSGTDIDPGWWYVLISDVESGIEEVQILIDGKVFIHDQNLNGQQSISYLEIEVPGSAMSHTIEVFVTNYDTDRDGDQQISSEIHTVEVIHTDVTPPVISLTPPSIIITDEEAIGGVLLEWTISDESGISEAVVSLNGEIITSYTGPTSISDSYLLVENTPGDYVVEIIAVDTNGLASSIQSTITIVDDDTTAPTISIQYFGTGTEYDPGIWNIVIEDLESGLDDVQILIQGYKIIHENLGGQQSISYQIEVPGSVGIHTLEVIVTNNDIDWVGDQESTSETDTVEIVHDPFPPPLIPGERIWISKPSVVKKVPI